MNRLQSVRIELSGVIHVDEYLSKEYSVYYGRRLKSKPQLELEAEKPSSTDKIAIKEQREDGFKIVGHVFCKKIKWYARGE